MKPYYVKKIDDRDRFKQPTNLMSADKSNENLSTTSDRLGCLSTQVNNTGFPSNSKPESIGSNFYGREKKPAPIGRDIAGSHPLTEPGTTLVSHPGPAGLNVSPSLDGNEGLKKRLK